MYSKTFEDYLEAIYRITQRKGYARTKDISQELEISSPSVTEMLGKLDREGLVNHERYSGVSLTPEGERIARTVKSRHETLRKFLEIILVSEKTAEIDACEIEHEISPETIEQLTKFVKFVETAPIHPKWIGHFKEFCRTGEYVCGHEGCY
jgi:DtxR family Mn-dependent transcriptional regulator